MEAKAKEDKKNMISLCGSKANHISNSFSNYSNSLFHLSRPT
jgi:hypothetical protein